MPAPSGKIKIIRVGSSAGREGLLEEFIRARAANTTWVVADVRSKLSIQRRLLLQTGFAEANAVLRLSELWRSAARVLLPDVQIVSRELILTALGSSLREFDEAWLQAPGAAKTARAYIGQLLPVLATEMDEGSEAARIFQEWLDAEDNVASRERWGAWFEVSRKLWRGLHAAKLCDSHWLPGALVGRRQQLSTVIANDLVVDVGTDLSHIEAELFLELAKNQSITLFRPSPEWETQYPNVSMSFDWMQKVAIAQGIKVEVETVTDRPAAEEWRPNYKRLPSASAEVKDAVAQARLWLDNGVAAAEIAIVAPDLEVYWPVLALHLDSEGIVASKSVVSPLHSFSDIARWLARMRVRTGIPDSRDLESDLFGEEAPPISYSSFQEVFSRIYDKSDLELSVDVVQFYEKRYSDRGQWSDEPMARDAFLSKALRVLSEGDDLGRAVRLFKTVLEECPPDLAFRPSQWVRYWSEIAARVEVNVIPAQPMGITCVNLVALEGLPCTHVVVMGLHEGALRANPGTAIHMSDLSAIERETGWVLDGEDRKRVEFAARWALLQRRKQMNLLFADADLSGSVQTPSWAWLSGAWARDKAAPAVEVPRATRLDELQKRDVSDIGSSTQRERLSRERGEIEHPNFAAGAVRRLSATTIDRMSKCSLRFAFDRILGPRDEGRLDLDADRSRQGRLQHKIFELLGRQQWVDQTDDELLALIEQAKREFEGGERKALVRDGEAWLSMRRRLLRVARGLLRFEHEQRRQAPALRTVACEIGFQGVLPDGKTPITGQIDRVDATTDGRIVIVDYKRTTNEQSFSQWKKSQSWQPLVYAWVAERGFLNGKDAIPGETLPAEPETVGIFLYDTKRQTRGLGFRIKEGNEDLFSANSRKAQTREDLDAAFAEIETKMASITEKLSRGEFRPDPNDKNDCKRCGWREACRAAHLEIT